MSRANEWRLATAGVPYIRIIRGLKRLSPDQPWELLTKRELQDEYIRGSLSQFTSSQLRAALLR